MNTIDFLENKPVQEVIANLKNSIKDKIFSDVVDAEGNQYVDLVQEGGGILGIALLGYTYVLEQSGIRFFSLAGTSAGAINTLLLAAVDKIDKPKTEKILEILANKNLFDLVDGPFNVRQLFSSLSNNSWIGIKLFWALSILPYLIKNKGLNPGNDFKAWISDILKQYKVQTKSDLIFRIKKPDSLKVRDGRSSEDLKPKLKIITAEITTETRVIFPEMDCLFWDDPRNINPAEYLRASMSIPLFFQPLIIIIGKNIKKSDWEEIVKYHGNLPEEANFVDGGILSNFPIDVFHNYNIIPRLPTFGVKLGDDRNQVNTVNSIPKFLMSIFNSSRHVLDYQFLLVNPDYENLIQKVDIGNHNWLNFSIKDEDKLDLFLRGAKAASEFLTKFDWEGYKKSGQI